MDLSKLESDNFFKNIIKVFPRWMDIRKRPKSSDGGLFLLSIAEEFNNVAVEINEYTKDFFILYYIGKEDKIIDYLYIAEVGEDDTFELADSTLTLTTDSKEFYLNDSMCLYQYGYIFIKPADAVVLLEYKMFYKVNSIKYGITLDKTHIWNAIDEFAMFSGLKRYDDEINKSLLNRTLNCYKNPTSSTYTGLKNAIANCMSQEETVSEDEIIIEPIDEDNAFLIDDNYNSYENIYEYIAYLNQDVYKTKKWDISDWDHSFKTLKYIPTKWNEPLIEIQNGVGGNDALNVIADPNSISSTTDVTVNAYEESEYTINEYIKNNNIKKDINLNMVKYNDVLNTMITDYKITAANVIDINNENIYIEALKKIDGNMLCYLQDLILDISDIANLTINDRGALKESTAYSLVFTPTGDFSNMIINSCAINNNTILKELNEFKFDSNGHIVNTNVKLHATSTDDLSGFTNITNVINDAGVTLSDASIQGKITINTNGMEGNYLVLSTDCKEVSIDQNDEYVSTNNMQLNSSGEWVSQDSNGNQLTININCNSLSFSTIGNCSVSKYVNGTLESTKIIADPEDTVYSFDTTTQVKVVVQRLGLEQLTVKNIQMASYSIGISLKSGELIKTGMGTIIPTTKDNELYIVLTAATAFAPIINYIHIGANIKNSSYKLDFTTGTGVQELNIDSECIVELIESTGGSQTVTANYITKGMYTNNTTDNITVKINTDNFYSISDSTPKMSSTTYNGSDAKYITIMPGTSIDTITVTGSSLKLIIKNKLKDLLCSISGIQYTDITYIYVSKLLKGFILKTNSKEQYVRINRDNVSGEANIFRLSGVPNTINGVFTIKDADETEIISNKIEINFEYLSMQPKDNVQSIAYNEYKTILSINKDIQIVNQFYPALVQNQLMFYNIDTVSCNSGDATIYFNKSDSSKETWSIGSKKLNIEITVNKDSNYKTDVELLTEEFQLSNTIYLDNMYNLNGTDIELARYIISNPTNMIIKYEQVGYEETIVIDNSGFNKLYYSNISGLKVGDATITTSMFNLFNDEGIIGWLSENLDDLAGKSLHVSYNYSKPVSISFNSISDLYEVVGYIVTAYKLSDGYPKTYVGLKDNDYIDLDSTGRITVSCSNVGFIAAVDSLNKIIKINRINIDNDIIVKAGYFYYDGLEYYHFADKEETKFDKMSHITTHNTQVLADEIIFGMQSSNYVLDSTMRQKRLQEVCIIDFKNNGNIEGISTIGSITACDNFNDWYQFDMDISFKVSENGYGTHFAAASDQAFACIDITKNIANGMIATLKETDGITISIGRDILYDDMPFTRSIAVEPYDVMETAEGYLWYQFDNLDSAHKYYLIVTGSGLVDDIIIRNGDISDPTNGHVKNISLLGYTIDETKLVGYVEQFKISPIGSLYNNAEITSEGILRTGSSIDWGMTKIYQVDNSLWSGCEYTAKLERTLLLSQSDTDYIMTPAIYLKNKGSIKNVIIKVNDYIVDNTKGFSIQLLTSSTADGSYTTAGSLSNTNIIEVGKNRILGYVKAKIIMPKNKVINNIEIFAEYAQTAASVLKAIPYNYGTIQTKLYDIGDNINIRATKIEADNISEIDKIFISIRGCRNDGQNIVWTEWKAIPLNSDLTVENTVEFYSYSLFQFKIELYDESAAIRINNIDFEVIS